MSDCEIWKDKDWLQRHYCEQKLSQQECARLAGCDRKTISYWLKKYNIPTPHKVYQDKNWLQEHYCKQELSLQKCGRLAGCGQHAIHYWLQRHGVPRRTNSETTKIALARGGYTGNSEKMKAAWARGAFADRLTDDLRQKRSEIAKAAWTRGCHDNKFTEERRQRMSEAIKAAWARGVFDSKETRQKMSDAQKAAWERGDYDGVFQSPTNIEIAISKALDKLGIMHVQQYRPAGCRFTYDEYLLAQGILLEVNGDYWHTKEGAPEKDAHKETWAKEQGFIPITIWEHEIKERGALAMIQERIE